MAGLNNQRTQQKIIGANEDMFLKAFDSTPKLNIATQKKLENELSRVVATISNPNADWDNRVQAMKYFRSLVNSGISDSEDFYSITLKSLEIPFQNNICDLRSQVVRETCITIAFLSCRLQQKFSRMAEILLPSLIKLIPNSAKIISTSALVALRFIIQSTHNSKLITIIKYQLSTSKSKDIHRALCEIAERIVTIWPPIVIERHINDFQEVLRLGICDSDESARQYARRAFNVFAEHFREHADRLFNSLDQQRQRMLNNLNHGGGSTLSINGYGSTTSGLNTIGTTTATYIVSRLKSSLMSTNGTSSSSSTTTTSTISNSSSTATPSKTTSTPSRIRTPSNCSSTATPIKTTSTPSRIRTPTARSTSAIDVDAQRRARARAVYLSSMYQRPRQLDTITPSPAKSNIPQPMIATAEKRDAALSKAASYLLSVINNNNIAESQIVTTIKYFNSLIEKHPPETVNQLLSELMPPLVVGIDNAAISVRKASVFAMVAIYAKVGLNEMETYLTRLTMTQRKLLEVYIKKFNEENGANKQLGCLVKVD